MFEPKRILEAEVCGFRSPTEDTPDMLWCHATLETRRWCGQQAAINVVIQMAALAATSGSEDAYLLFQNPPFTKSVYSGKYTTDVSESLFLSRDRVRSPTNFSEAKVTWLKNLMKLYSLNPSWSKTRQIQALSPMEWADYIEDHGNTIQAEIGSRAISQDNVSSKDSHISLASAKDSITTVTKVAITTRDDAFIKDSTSTSLEKGRVFEVAEAKSTQGSQPTLPMDEPKTTAIWKKRKCETDSREAKKKPTPISNNGDMESTEIVVFGAEDCSITREDRAWINNEERQQRLIEARSRETEVQKEVEKARHWEAETRKRKHEACHEPETETKKRILESSHQRQPESSRRLESFRQRQSESYRNTETFYQRQSETNRRPETFHQRQPESYRSTETFNQRLPESYRSTEAFYQRQPESYRSTKAFYQRQPESNERNVETFYQRQPESRRREHETFYHPAMYYRRHRY